jgi:peptidyl-Asp metalloendopeptidase
MVVYTPLARDDEGGTDAIEARAVLAINQANTAYTNSQAVARLTLAYTGVVDYVESNAASTDVSRLRSTTDGYMDVIHCIRDAFAADMVALLVNNLGSACGVAYLQTNPGPGFATSAFSVTDKDCIGGHTFTHELGHNMGCAHDRDNAGSAAFSYAYGYRTPDQVYRTIMSYAPGTRVGRFSNPTITYNGYVMGIPLGEAGETFNAQCITNTAPIIQNFRTGAGLDADYNQDGNVDQDDVAYLIGVIAGGDNPTGRDPDFNADGNTDQDDVAALINAIAGGGCQ